MVYLLNTETIWNIRDFSGTSGLFVKYRNYMEHWRFFSHRFLDLNASRSSKENFVSNLDHFKDRKYPWYSIERDKCFSTKS